MFSRKYSQNGTLHGANHKLPVSETTLYFSLIRLSLAYHYRWQLGDFKNKKKNNVSVPKIKTNHEMKMMSEH